MRRGGVVLFFAILCSLLFSLPIDAQIPKQSKVIIESVEINDSTHLPEATRNQLIGVLKQREFVGTSDPHWFEMKLDEVVRGALPNQTDREKVYAECYRIIRTDSSGIHVSATIQLEENPLTTSRLASIRFENASDPTTATLFPSEEMRKLFPLRDGEIFNVESINKGLDAVQRLYASSGYIDATVNGQIELDREHKTVAVHLELDSGPKYRVGNIQVVGLDRTVEDTLKLELKSGDVFSIQAIHDFFSDNESVLPVDAPPRDVKYTRDRQNGVVDISFDFRALPNPQVQN
jgi:hypothetical protein